MSRRRPSTDQVRFSDTELGMEIEDRPDLPVAERLERAANRFERRVERWQQTIQTDDATGIETRVEAALGDIARVLEDPERIVHGAEAFTAKRLETSPARARKRMISQLKHSGMPQDRRVRKYDDAEREAVDLVLEHHGAARWWERPGNAERLTRLHEQMTERLTKAG